MRYVILAADFDGTLARGGRVAATTVDALQRLAATGAHPGHRPAAMMEPGVRSVLAGALAALFLAACDRADQSKLESDAKKAWNETKQAARKAGAEIKRETKEAVAQASETLKEVGETTGRSSRTPHSPPR